VITGGFAMAIASAGCAIAQSRLWRLPRRAWRAIPALPTQSASR
jgi:hypothetical protein